SSKLASAPPRSSSGGTSRFPPNPLHTLIIRRPDDELAGRTALRVPALQAGRQGAWEAVLPVRDVPRHGDEPRRRVRDRRPGDRLAVHRHPRRAQRAAGRPGDEDVRAATRLVLLLPLLPAPDL